MILSRTLNNKKPCSVTFKRHVCVTRPEYKCRYPETQLNTLNVKLEDSENIHSSRRVSFLKDNNDHERSRVEWQGRCERRHCMKYRLMFVFHICY